MLTDFRNSFTAKLSEKFAVGVLQILELEFLNKAITKYSVHFKRVATLWNINVKKLAKVIKLISEIKHNISLHKSDI